MKKNYSKVTIILLSVMSLVLGVGVVYLELVSPKAAPGCELDRVQNVPPNTPMPISGKRPFVLTLVNKNLTEVGVTVTITGVNNPAGSPIVKTYTIPPASSPSKGYKSVVVDVNLGGCFPGTEYEYNIDLTNRNAGLSNVYAVYADDVEFIR